MFNEFNEIIVIARKKKIGSEIRPDHTMFCFMFIDIIQKDIFSHDVLSIISRWIWVCLFRGQKILSQIILLIPIKMRSEIMPAIFKESNRHEFILPYSAHEWQLSNLFPQKLESESFNEIVCAPPPSLAGFSHDSQTLFAKVHMQEITNNVEQICDFPIMERCQTKQELKFPWDPNPCLERVRKRA